MTKWCLKDGVCGKVVSERWCVTKWCDKVVCEKWCVTKWCVKDGVSKMVCDKIVCERWCVKDGA